MSFVYKDGCLSFSIYTKQALGGPNSTYGRNIFQIYDHFGEGIFFILYIFKYTIKQVIPRSIGRGAYRGVVGRPDGIGQLGRPRRRWIFK
jgi:hypothetical protein